MAFEIRWFFSGSTANHIIAWFKDKHLGDFLPEKEERLDIYLLTEDLNFGIKLRGEEVDRGGKLEVKWRLQQESYRDPEGIIQGKLEDWEKWGWDYTPGKSDKKIIEAIQKEAEIPWVRVEKVRLQRKYELTHGKLVSIPEEKRSEAGCNIELTNLVFKENKWWSLALDLFSTKGDDVRTILNIAATTLFKDYPGPPLQDKDSFSYPEWLYAKIEKKSA